MNIRKPVDYSAMFTALDTLMAADLPQTELYCRIGRLVSGRAEKGAAVAAAEYLSNAHSDVSGFSPRNLRRMRDFYRTYKNNPDILVKAMTIGWTQNMVILEAELTLQERAWYIRAVGQFGWSKLELTKKIREHTHETATLDSMTDLCYSNRSGDNADGAIETSRTCKIMYDAPKNYRGERMDNNMIYYFSELNKGIAPNPGNNVFSDIWGEYERVILHSLVTSFGLDFLVHDQCGGDVDTVHGVRETRTFKNPTYIQKYNERGRYSTYDYHSDGSYRKVTAEARRQFNKTGTPIDDTYAPGNLLCFNKGMGPWRRASLDHIIAAHEIHDDPVRILADLDGISLANDPENLRYTSLSLNAKMSDMTIDEFILWCDEHPDKVNWNGEKGATLPDEVKQRLREEDVRERELYEARIAKSYYTSPQFYADAVAVAGKRGLEMGARQALGFIFIEIYYSCKKELEAVPPGSDFRECFEAITRGIPKGLDNAHLRYKNLMSQFAQGFWAGALASLTTTLCNMFFTTEKNMVRYIRQGYAAVVQAGNVLLINPDDLLLGDQLKMTTVILGSGASVIAGTYVGDLMSKTPIASMPEVGPTVTRFVSVLVSGLLSCTMLILLDRSKLVNTLVGKMNQYATVEHSVKETSKAFESIVAELEGFDIDVFSTQCLQYSLIAVSIDGTSSEEELSHLLSETLTASGIDLPWDGDFDAFMSDPSSRLVFS